MDDDAMAKPPKPGRLEKLRRVTSEVVAAARLGNIGKAADYIRARSSDFMGRATPEQHDTLLEVATHAAALDRLAKTKIEAVFNPEKRYKKPAVAKEAHPDH